MNIFMNTNLFLYSCSGNTLYKIRETVGSVSKKKGIQQIYNCLALKSPKVLLKHFKFKFLVYICTSSMVSEMRVNSAWQIDTIIIIIYHFIYTLKSKVQILFSSVHIVRSKYNIIQVKKFEYVYLKSKTS